MNELAELNALSSLPSISRRYFARSVIEPIDLPPQRDFAAPTEASGA
jgi:hypothetical protein